MAYGKSHSCFMNFSINTHSKLLEKYLHSKNNAIYINNFITKINKSCIIVISEYQRGYLLKIMEGH